MIKIRKSAERGVGDHGWLSSRHTFSFASYHDDRYMGYGPLRVINEDHIKVGSGFDTHSHQNMEIISYVVDGALAHKDSTGREKILHPIEVQRMSAGRGIEHSEYNPSLNNETHFLQIWIKPDLENIEPSYEQKSFKTAFGCNDIVLVVSKHGRDGSLSINQDVDIYLTRGQAEGEKKLHTYPHRHLWVQVIKGDVSIDDIALSDGDGAAIENVDLIYLKWNKGAEFIVLDMP